MEIVRHVSLNALCLSEPGLDGSMPQHLPVENEGFLLFTSAIKGAS